MRPPGERRTYDGKATSGPDTEFWRLREENARLGAMLRQERQRSLESLRQERQRSRKFVRTGRRLLDSLRSRVGDRRMLEIQQNLLRAVESVECPEEVGRKLLETLGRDLGREAGILWEPRSGVLRCQRFWRAGAETVRFEQACRESAFARGEGLPGRSWEHSRPLMVEDLADDEGDDRRFRRGVEEGLRSAWAFPVRGEGGIVWVAEFFGKEPEECEEVLLRTLSVIGDQLGRTVERRRTEQALKESEANLRLAQRTAGLGHWEWNLSSGEFSASPICKAHFGRAPEEVLAYEDLLETIHPEDREYVEEVMRRALFERTDCEAEYRVVVASGEVRHILARGSAVRSVDGAAPSISGVTLDITERKRAEGARAYLATLVKSTNDAVVGLDEDFNIASWNRGAQKIFGYRADEMVGRSIFDLIPAEYHENAKSNRERLERGEEIHDYIARFFTRGGEVVHVSMSINPVIDGADNSGFVWVMQDITERKRREASTAFSAEIAEDLSRLSTSGEIMQTVGAKIGAHLKLATINFLDVDESRDEDLTVSYFWGKTDVPNLPGTFRIKDYLTGEFARASRAGEITVIRNTQTDLRTDARACARHEIGALVGVPFHRNGEWKHFFSATDTQPRDWREDEIELFQELANRVFPRLERARAEEALRASEERLQKAISIETVGVLFFNLDGHTIDANEAFERMSGYSRDELVSTAHWKVLTAPEFIEATERVAQELATRGETAPYEKELVRKDGSRWWALCAPKLLTSSESECVEFILDITESKRAQEALRESEQWLRLSQEAASSGTWEWDLLGRDIRWSREHYDLFGFDPEEPVTFEKWWKNVPPDDVRRIEEAWRRCAAGQKEVEVEYRVVRDGEVRWMDARGQTTFDKAGRAERVLGITVDFTGRKRAAEERERLHLQEWTARAEAAEREKISRDLHDYVAHEMGVAHQSLELYDALAPADPERAAGRLRLAKEMVKSSLDTTRQLSSELRPLDAEENLEDTLEDLAEALASPETQISLSFRGDGSALPGRVRGQIYLILREALTNAARHSDAEKVCVEVSTENGSVIGRVSDDGRGFEAGSADNRGGRRGVGLDSMRERAGLLGGELHVDSAPGEGTRVEVHVPFQKRGRR